MYPVVCSSFALKSLCKKGARDCNRASLCELLELATNLDGNAIIPISSFATLDEFADNLTELDRALGHRLADIALPPVWSRDGVYLLGAMDGALTIMHRFKNVAVKLDEGDYMKYKPGEAYVEKNYAEQSAVLRQPGVAHGLVFASEFPQFKMNSVGAMMRATRKAPSVSSAGAPSRSSSGAAPPALLVPKGPIAAAPRGRRTPLRSVPSQMTLRRHRLRRRRSSTRSPSSRPCPRMLRSRMPAKALAALAPHERRTLERGSRDD